MERITIEWGHTYGKPYGFREIKQAEKRVAAGELVEVSRVRWSSRGPKGGLRHGFQAVFQAHQQ